MGNVDLSCCGVSWDGKTIYENYPDAVSHCQHKVYGELWDNQMHNIVTVEIRKRKLAGRGWCNLKYMKDDEIRIIERDMRLDDLLDDGIRFTVEHHPNLREIIDPDFLPF